MSRRWVRGALEVGAALGTAALLTLALSSALRVKVLAYAFGLPNVVWATRSAADAGLDAEALERLWASLRARRTTAFLVARGGALVFERYQAPGAPNHLQPTSAAAKGLTGISALLVCLQDGRIALDDLLARHVPSLETAGPRSHIRIRDLAFHTAGLDDVDFLAAGQGKVEGWAREYFDHPERRFDYALHRVPMLFEPGTGMRYSGVGYYALAYALMHALLGAPQSDLETLLRERVMRPLGIPRAAWSLSYGKMYEQDGLHLYAIGSGGAITPRAAARIGEWMRLRGRWEGRVLVDARHVESVLGGSASEQRRLLSSNHGWDLNLERGSAALPPDAFYTHGAGDQLVLVVPSLELVVVRNGDDLDPHEESTPALLERELFAPLRAAVRAAP